MGDHTGQSLIGPHLLYSFIAICPATSAWLGPSWVYGVSLDISPDFDHQDAFRHSNKNSATISPDESLWDFFQVEVVRRIPESKPDFATERQFVFQLAEMWGAFIGSPITSQSLKFFWLEECIDGENLFCAGTYRKILQSITKPAEEGADIKLSTKVTQINARDDADKVTLVTDKGDLEFDEVVVTAPLGWLQQNPDAFVPALSPRLTKAINSIGYGCLEKVMPTEQRPTQFDSHANLLCRSISVSQKHSG